MTTANDKTPPMIVGIDLGTTNSLVAVCDAAGPRILQGPTGRAILPSVVRLDPATGKPAAIGDAARDAAVEHPEVTIHSAKRLMGRGLGDVVEDAAQLPYAVVAGEHDTARIKIGEHIISPQEVSAMILRELKQWAEAALGQPVSKAVVTVPAYFDDAQRQATRDAGRLAGLEVVRIVNEPTAAALAYGLGRGKTTEASNEETQETVSGTVSLTKAEKKVPGTFSLNTKLNPAACSGDAEGAGSADAAGAKPQAAGSDAETIAVYDLGGGTFDLSILKLQETEYGSVDQVLATAGDTHLGGDDVDRMLIDLVMGEVREQFGGALEFPPSTRQALRHFAEQTKIKLSTDDSASIQIDLGQGRVYDRTVSRDAFETMIGPWVQRTLDCCKAALSSAKLTIDDIDRVVMVGGSTRIPAVQAAVGAFFKTDPYTALDPDRVVALGAATLGRRLSGIGQEQQGLLLDVIPLSLGIETMGGAVAKLITANSTIPARATEMFSTYAEGQTKVAINVYQGERELVQDCRLLGAFDLTGIPPMPAGLPKVEVSFMVDANGVLTVSATEQRSGRRARIQVVPNHGLTREEVDRIEQDSFAHAKADMTAHRLIDLKLNAKLDLRNIQRQLDRVGDELDPAYRAEINAHMAKVQLHIDTPDETASADQFHEDLTAMDHATIQLAEAAIAQTLRQEQAGP